MQKNDVSGWFLFLKNSGVTKRAHSNVGTKKAALKISLQKINF